MEAARPETKISPYMAATICSSYCGGGSLMSQAGINRLPIDIFEEGLDVFASF
jgi:hypothetical protein